MRLKGLRRQEGLTLRVRVKPCAPSTRIKEYQENVLRIDIKAPPVRGKANKECIRFLVQTLKVSTVDVRIISGLRVKDKLIRVSGIDQERASRLLQSEKSKHNLD
jgi:uncharacterized protein (TIGR00251 family)